jgi:hypothetical protein
VRRVSPRRSRSRPNRSRGAAVGVDYGFDEVRFINPVKVGSHPGVVRIPPGRPRGRLDTT